jgi:hypothetical protein
METPLPVAAGKQYSAAWPTRAWVGQRSVRIRHPVGQH